MSKIYHFQSHHTMCVSPVTEVPANCEGSESYSHFYQVQNWDKTGVTFMWIGKGHRLAPKQYVVWYPNGRMWSSFGTTIQGAIEGAQQDGWMYAK